MERLKRDPKAADVVRRNVMKIVRRIVSNARR